MKKIFLYLIVIVIPGLQTLFAQSEIIQQIEKFINEADYAEALELISIHQTSTREENIILKNKQAEILIRTGQLDQASEILKQTRELISLLSSPARFESITYTNLGFLQLNLGRNDLAEENLKLAIELLERSGAGQSAELAQALSTMGLIYTTTGKYNQALEHQLRALQIRQSLFGNTHTTVAASLNDLGLLYSFLNADEALNYYEKALAIYEQLYDKFNPRIAQANTNIGFVYSSMEFFGDAILNFEEALKIWDKIYDGPHPNKAFVLFNMGRTYYQMNDRPAAMGYYQRALDIYTSSYGEKHPDIAQIHNQIASLKMSDDDWEQALTHLQKAIIANVPAFSNQDYHTNPTIDQYYNGVALLYSLQNKAIAFEQKHYFKTLKFKDLEKALGSIQSCDTLIDKLRRQSSNESDKIAVGIMANEVYENGVRLGKAMSEITWKTKEFLELSFYFAEKSKSAVLLDAISESEAKSFANIPDDVIEEERSLKATLAFCAQKLAEKPSEEEERALREAYFDLSRNYEAFVKTLEVNYPEYYNLKFSNIAPTASALQRKLPKQTALISYFVAEKEQRIYIYTITSEKFRVESKAIDKNFNRYLIGFRNSIYFRDASTYVMTAQALHKLLMPAKIPGHIKELVVIPTGRLGTIPFEALIHHKSKIRENSFTNLPYLLNQYAVSYEFAATLLLQDKSSKEATSNYALLCAPIEFTANSNLPTLPGTEQEVNSLNKLLTKYNFQSEVITQQQATEERMKSSRLKNYRLVHLATHGIVDEVNPELSRIFLNTSENSGEDGNLFSGEIYNIEFNADLVILSACQTGLGKVSKGEGVIGLSRALIYAGAKQLIVSYWSVADESTATLMITFYQYLLENGNLKQSSLALQKAKQTMVKESTYAEPYFWAPFVLIGY